MSWEEEVADDWEQEVGGEEVGENWEDEANGLFDASSKLDNRVDISFRKEMLQIVSLEEKINIEERLKGKSKKEKPKKYDENKGVHTNDMDIPLSDPLAEKERLKKISENADAKILDEMFGGIPDDAYISDIEKGLKMIHLKDITDYQQLAYKLGKKMAEQDNITSILEFITCVIRECGGKLSADDFQKLASTCNVLKEDRKREEKAMTKKGKKKGKPTATVKMGNDNWQDRMEDEDGDDNDYDDFM